MSKRILVTGGAGLLGRHVVPRLLDAGHEVRVMSRRPRPADHDDGYEWVTADLEPGTGVAAGLAGVDVVLHLASGTKAQAEQRIAASLLDAARAQPTPPHVIYMSIVGVDRVPFPYYRAKLRAEELVERSGVPYTILRATQFHDLVRVLLATAARSPVMPVPAIPDQPVDAAEVADRLVELAAGPPVGRVADLAGPQVRQLPDLARAYLRATGRRRLVLPVRLPGRIFRAFRAGHHTAPAHAAGRITFEEYLSRQADPRRLAYRS